MTFNTNEPSNKVRQLLSPASLAGAGDIETHRVRLSVRLSVRPDGFVQAISRLLFTVGGRNTTAG